MSRPEKVRRTICVFTRYRHLATGNIIPIRRVLTNVFFSSDSNEVALRTGNIIKENLFVQIFKQDNLKYEPIHVWQNIADIKELDEIFSIEEGINGTIICPFSPDELTPKNFEFSWLPATGAESVAQAEQAFISNNPGALRVQKVENRMFGVLRGHHLSVRA